MLIIFQIMKLGWSHSKLFQNSKRTLSHFTSSKKEGLIIGSLSYCYNVFASLLIILTMILTIILILTMNNSWFIIHHIDIISVWWFGTFFNILGIIFPTDELIFFRGVGILPTRYDSILFPYLAKIYRKTPYFL